MALNQFVRLMARIIIGLYFVVLGGDKLIRGTFTAPHFLSDWATQQIAEGHAFSAFQPFLEQIVIPNGRIISWVFAGAEFALGIALISGVLIGPVALLGAVQVACILLASGKPAPGTALSTAIAGTLPFVPLMLLLLVISAEEARAMPRIGGGGGSRSKKKE
jgi:hypothetical protein